MNVVFALTWRPRNWKSSRCNSENERNRRGTFGAATTGPEPKSRKFYEVGKAGGNISSRRTSCIRDHGGHPITFGGVGYFLAGGEKI